MQVRNKFGRFYFIFIIICAFLIMPSKGVATNQFQSQACPVVFAPQATAPSAVSSASIKGVLAQLEALRASALEREKSRKNENAMVGRQELIDLGLADDLLLERALVDEDLRVVMESNALDRSIAWALMGEGNRTRRDVDTAIDNFDSYTLEGKWNVLKKVVENLVYAIDLVDLKVMNVPEQRAQSERLGISIREYLRFMPVWEQQSKRSFNEVMIAILTVLHHPSKEQKLRILGQVDQLNKFTLWYSKKGVRPELVVDSDHGGITTPSLKTYFEGASRLAREAMLAERFGELTEAQIVVMQTWKGWDTLPEQTKEKLTHKFVQGNPAQIEMAAAPESVVVPEAELQVATVPNLDPVRSSDGRFIITNSSAEVENLMRKIESIHGQEAFLRALTELFPNNLQKLVESRGRLLTPDEALFIANRLRLKSQESGFDFQGERVRIHKENPLQNYRVEMLRALARHFSLGSLCGVGFCLGQFVIGAQTEFSLVGGVLLGSAVTAVGSASTFMDRKNTIKVSPTVGAVLTQVLPRTDLSSIRDDKLSGFFKTLFPSDEDLVVIGEFSSPNGNGGFRKYKSGPN